MWRCHATRRPRRTRVGGPNCRVPEPRTRGDPDRRLSKCEGSRPYWLTVGTQLAAVVVTDLVGSTETRVRLGEEGAEALRRVHDRMLRAAVVDCGGVVVKGLGDGLLAYFSGAADAVSAAVAIQQAVASHSARRPEEALDIRVGIAAGDVSVEDDDVFGTPVVEASRLCAVAGGGQIVVADLVRVLGRGRGGHTFNPIGDLELKGLPDAVIGLRGAVGTRRGAE